MSNYGVALSRSDFPEDFTNAIDNNEVRDVYIDFIKGSPIPRVPKNEKFLKYHDIESEKIHKIYSNPEIRELLHEVNLDHRLIVTWENRYFIRISYALMSGENIIGSFTLNRDPALCMSFTNSHAAVFSSNILGFEKELMDSPNNLIDDFINVEGYVHFSGFDFTKLLSGHFSYLMISPIEVFIPFSFQSNANGDDREAIEDKTYYSLKIEKFNFSWATEVASGVKLLSFYSPINNPAFKNEEQLISIGAPCPPRWVPR